MKVSKILFISILIISIKKSHGKCETFHDCNWRGICIGIGMFKDCKCVLGYKPIPMGACSSPFEPCAAEPCSMYNYNIGGMWVNSTCVFVPANAAIVNSFTCDCQRIAEETCFLGVRELFRLPLLYFDRVLVYPNIHYAVASLLGVNTYTDVWYEIIAHSETFHWGYMNTRTLGYKITRNEIDTIKDPYNATVWPPGSYLKRNGFHIFDFPNERRRYMTFELQTYAGKSDFSKKMDFFIANDTCCPTFEPNNHAILAHDYEIIYECANCFDVMLTKPCGYVDVFRHSWYWMTLGNEVELRNFQVNETKLATIPETFKTHRKHYHFGDPKHNRFVVKYIFEEWYNHTEPIHGIYIYIRVYHDAPQIVIHGNHFTYANARKTIVVNANDSSELGKKTPRTIQYRWGCSSTDYGNSFCTNTNEAGYRSTIEIPPETLNKSYEYTFTLNVSTTISTKEQVFSQTIQLLDHDVLKAHIECIRNCKDHKYNNDEILHLFARCINCESPTLKYQWLINNQVKGHNKRLLVPVEDRQGDLTIKLKILWGSKWGESVYKIKPHDTAPVAFSCNLSPTSYSELDTRLIISCSKNKVSYSFYTNSNEKIMYTTFGGHPLNPILMHHTDKLVIRGCDTKLSCKRAQIKTSVSNQPIINHHIELYDFIYRKQNYSKLISYGRNTDISNIFIFASKQLKNIKDFWENKNITDMLLDRVENKNRTCQVDRHGAFTMIAEIFLSAMQTEMPFLRRISNFVDKIVLELFYHNLKCHGLCKTTLYDFEIFNRNIYNTFHKLISVLKPHNLDFRDPQRATNDPVTDEEYQDYSVIDYSILYEMGDLLQITRQFKVIMHNLAATASLIVYSGEPIITYNFGHTCVRIDFLDFYNLQPIQIECEKIIITFSLALQKEFFRIFGTKKEVTIQTVIMERNIQRWVPDASQIYSRIVYINLVNGKDKLHINDDLKRIDINAPLKIKFPTTNMNPDKMKQYTKYEYGHVNQMWDMPIYRIEMPRDSLVTIYIDEQQEDLLVLHRIGSKPTYTTFLNTKYKYLPKHSVEEIQLINHYKEDAVAYLSILPANFRGSNFRIKIMVYSCNVFFYHDKKWHRERCLIRREEITPEYIPCYCLHLTAFALSIHLPRIELEANRKVLHEIPISKVFSLFLAVVALLFTILFVIAYLLERKSKKIIVIPSVCKLGDYKYSVTFFTGLQNNAGTTANIKVNLYGSKCDDTFILPRSLFRNSFSSGSATTVIFVTRYLGQILKIGVSIDNYGHSASWYLHMVRIKDIEKKHEYIFLVQQWLSLIYCNSMECLVKLTSEMELKRKKLLCNEYSKCIFADSEYQFLQYQGRLNQSRKTMILFTTIMVTILVLAIFFEKTTLQNYQEEDENLYREMFPLKYITFAILAALISLVVSNLLVILFTEKGGSKYKLVHRNRNLIEV